MEKYFKLKKKYKEIIITGEYWKPRIYYEFYKKSLPQTIVSSDGFEKFGKYNFAGTVWDGGKILDEKQINNSANGKILVVLSEKEYESLKSNKSLLKLDEVRDYSGRNTIFVIASWQKN